MVDHGQRSTNQLVNDEWALVMAGWFVGRLVAQLMTKIIASLLIVTVTLLIMPRTNLAQTQQNTAGEQYLRDPKKKEKPDLKATFSAEMTRIKTGALNAEAITRNDSQSQQQQKPEFSKKDKIFLALFIVLTAGLVAVLIKHACKGENKCEDIDFNTDY